MARHLGEIGINDQVGSKPLLKESWQDVMCLEASFESQNMEAAATQQIVPKNCFPERNPTDMFRVQPLA